MAILSDTPISVLRKQVQYYESFIDKLQRKDGIDPTASDEKLYLLIKECREKINEFNDAIKRLDGNADNAPQTLYMSP